MSYGVRTKTIHRKLRLDKRKNSPNWYARLTLENGKRSVLSTRTDDFEKAKERALELYYDVNARVKNKLPAQTRKFKHVAKYAIKRMEDALENGTGKLAFNDYISALNNWLIPFFGKTDVDKIDLAALTNFDQWRTSQNKKAFSQSGINNHNSALNRVFDEAELQGWIVKSMRPTLLNKGAKSESRGSFTDDEYKTIYTTLRKWHHETSNEHAAATREVLRNYVLFLANTGIRQGREALGIRWRNIEWQTINGERYLVVNVDGKTKKRSVVARDTVEGYLDRQFRLNPAISSLTFSELMKEKSEEFVFTTRLGEVARVANLNRAFGKLLNELNLKVGADGKERTLYSLRHYYATRELKRGISTHTLSKQMGTSTAMLDRHYSKYSAVMNADVHSGRDMKKVAAPTATKLDDTIKLAFELLASKQLDEDDLLAALGVANADYKATKEIKNAALNATKSRQLSRKALKKILKT